MSPVEELTALYEQWRCLSREEGRAIDDADWDQVAQCQSGKTGLQPRIAELSQRPEVAAHETQFRSVVEPLMEMERSNQARLGEQRELAERQKQQLDRSSRQLRQLHQSYVAPARTNWQSYS